MTETNAQLGLRMLEQTLRGMDEFGSKGNENDNANLFIAGRKFKRAREPAWCGENKIRSNMGRIAYLMIRMRDCRVG